MQAYALQEQPAMAQDHYRRLQRRLRQELDVEPEAATRDLYQAIRAGKTVAGQAGVRLVPRTIRRNWSAKCRKCKRFGKRRVL